jgi:zinc/manganese transport system substrate-binding protein
MRATLPRRALLAAPLLAAPASVAPALGAAPLPVVASFSILADMVQAIGGARVVVTSLVGPDQDAHGFQPRPSDARAAAAARVMVINGLGFEAWAERLARSAGFSGTPVVASRGVKALRAGAHAHGHGHGHSHAAGAPDPHAWQDVANARLYVANIRDGLAAADPASAAAYQAGASAYLAQLDALEAEIRAAWAPLPRPSRRIVTSHDAFLYYGDAYGVDFLAPQSALSDTDPTPRQIAALIAQIRRERIRALFIENISSGTVLQQIARETGTRLGAKVYSDALSGPAGPAPSYVAMMRHNTRQFVAALS